MSENRKAYAFTIGGQKADPYRILLAYGITHPAQQHAIKKLLRAGRSHKTLAEDIAEVIQTLQRWQEMNAEEEPKAMEARCIVQQHNVDKTHLNK